MQHTKRYLLVPEDVYQSLTLPQDGSPIGLVRSRIKQIKNNEKLNDEERAINYEQELKRLNKLTKDEDEKPVDVNLQNLKQFAEAIPKPVFVKRPIIKTRRRHQKPGKATKQEEEEEEIWEDAKKSMTPEEILDFIYSNSESLGISEDGKILKADGRSLRTSNIENIVDFLLNKEKRTKEPIGLKDFIERAKQNSLLSKHLLSENQSGKGIYKKTLMQFKPSLWI